MGGGAGSSSTAAYFLGTGNQIYTASPLPLPSTIQPTQTGSLPTGLVTYDIAREGTNNNSTGDIWVATNQADSPIRAYNSVGTLTYACDLVPSVRGMAFSTSGGHRYLWVSNPSDNTIYQIDLDYGLGVEEGEGGSAVGLTVSENPFGGMTTLVGTGFSPGATLELFDLSGRRIIEAPFQEIFNLSGAGIPSGIYVARVTDPTGAMASLSVTKL